MKKSPVIKKSNNNTTTTTSTDATRIGQEMSKPSAAKKTESGSLVGNINVFSISYLADIVSAYLLPLELSEAIEDLSKISDYVYKKGNRNDSDICDWCQQNLMIIRHAIYDKMNTLPMLLAKYPKADHALIAKVYYSIAYHQGILHSRLYELGFSAIYPSIGDVFKGDLHESDISTWKPTDNRALHNQIESVLSIGFKFKRQQQKEIVLMKARVSRYLCSAEVVQESNEKIVRYCNAREQSTGIPCGTNIGEEWSDEIESVDPSL